MAKALLSSLIHEPSRLQICSLLVSVDEIEFKTLLSHLEASDSALSKHIKQLVDAGYVKQRKEPFGRYYRTWLSLTRKGREGFEQHVRELKSLISFTEGP